MKINRTKIKIINDRDLLCYGTILIDESIIIDGIKLLEGKTGRYIIMPIRRIKKRDISKNYVYPIKNDIRLKILQAISDEYDRQLAKDKE